MLISEEEPLAAVPAVVEVIISKKKPKSVPCQPDFGFFSAFNFRAARPSGKAPETLLGFPKNPAAPPPKNLDKIKRSQYI